MLTHGEVYTQNSPTVFQLSTDSRQIFKEIELFKSHGLKSERNFPSLVYVGGAGFPYQKLCINSLSLHLCTEQLVTVCHESVELEQL